MLWSTLPLTSLHGTLYLRSKWNANQSRQCVFQAEVIIVTSSIMICNHNLVATYILAICTLHYLQTCVLCNYCNLEIFMTLFFFIQVLRMVSMLSKKKFITSIFDDFKIYLEASSINTNAKTFLVTNDKKFYMTINVVITVLLSQSYLPMCKKYITCTYRNSKASHWCG